MSSIITIQIHHIYGARGFTFIAAASPERACELYEAGHSNVCEVVSGGRSEVFPIPDDAIRHGVVRVALTGR